MEGKIEPRYGCEFYVCRVGLICFKQDQPGCDDVSLMLHPDELEEMLPDLPALIKASRESLAEIKRNGLPDDTDEQGVEIPETDRAYLSNGAPK